MNHNQCKNVSNTAIRSFITFGSHSKVQGILPLPPFGGAHHIHGSTTLHENGASHVYSIQVSQRLSIGPLHAHWLIGLYYFMGNTLQQPISAFNWKGQSRILFKSQIRNCSHYEPNCYLSIFFFHILCSHKELYFCPKFIFALSKIAKNSPKSFCPKYFVQKF